MHRRARAGAAAGLAALSIATPSAAHAETRAGDTRAGNTERTLSRIASTHPSLRALPAPVRSLTTAGANASEVNAVADLVETLAPDARVRSVSKKGASFIVKAVADGRTQIYRVPTSMVQAAPHAGDAA